MFYISNTEKQLINKMWKYSLTQSSLLTVFFAYPAQDYISTTLKSIIQVLEKKIIIFYGFLME